MLKAYVVPQPTTCMLLVFNLQERKVGVFSEVLNFGPSSPSRAYTLPVLPQVSCPKG